MSELFPRFASDVQSHGPNSPTSNERVTFAESDPPHLILADSFAEMSGFDSGEKAAFSSFLDPQNMHTAITPAKASACRKVTRQIVERGWQGLHDPRLEMEKAEAAQLNILLGLPQHIDLKPTVELGRPKSLYEMVQRAKSPADEQSLLYGGLVKLAAKLAETAGQS